MRRKNRRKKLIIDALTIVAVVFSVYALHAGLQFFLATKAPLVVVAGGSMRPALEMGDLVIIRGVPATSINKGDIIAFEEPKESGQGNTTRIWPFAVYTVHRVVKIESSANGIILFTTKGDNNDIIDPRPVPDDRVHGRVIRRIPYIGYLILDPTITLTTTTIFVIIILIWPEKKRGLRRRRHIMNMNVKIVLRLFLIFLLSTIPRTEFIPYIASASFTDKRELVHGVSSGIIHIPEDYPSIQEAINAAKDGDIISVAAGKYYEHVSVNKAVVLLGKGATIDGNGTGDVISVTKDDVEIRGFTIQNGYRGIFLSRSIGSTIRSNTLISHTGAAIELWYSNRIIINSNNVSNSNHAIYLLFSSCGNTIRNNTLKYNSQGIALSWHCDANAIIGNTVTSNSFAGIALGGNNNNTIYHNNLINNPEHVYSHNSSNAWDNGAEGNYWSDYKGRDQNGDGMGDTRLPHKGFDYHPLMEPWSMTKVFDIDWGKETYHITTLCNSTVASFNFSETLKQISFKVTGPSGTVGFCNVTIPKNLIWADSPDAWLIEVDGTKKTSTIVEDATHTYLYFKYTYSTRLIKITGTSAIMDTTPPVANAGHDRTILRDEPITFDASDSSDDVGIVNYEWDFGDGNKRTGMTITHIFLDSGTYVITLTVRDRAGNNARNSATITVLRDTDFDGTPDVTDTDDDNDGMPDVWETERGVNPLIKDASFDLDNDGLTNLEEYLRDTNPLQPDSDGDFWTDSIDLMPKNAFVPNAIIISTAAILSAPIIRIIMRKKKISIPLHRITKSRWAMSRIFMPR